MMLSAVSDEPSCLEDEFVCAEGAGDHYGYCLTRPAQPVCNGFPNCRNGEDEENCPGILL